MGQDLGALPTITCVHFSGKFRDGENDHWSGEVCEPDLRQIWAIYCCCSVSQSCLTFFDPINGNTPGFPVLHCLLEFLKLMSIELVIPSSHLIPFHPLLLLPSIFPSFRVFSSESVLRISWPKYWSFSISLSNEYSGLTSF